MKSSCIVCMLAFCVLFFSNTSDAQNAAFYQKIDSLQSVVDESQDPTEVRQANFKLSKLYFKYKPDSALYFAQQHFALAKLAGDKEALATSNANLGLIYFYRNEYETSNDYFERSNELFEEIDMPRGVGINYSTMANYEARKGHHARALELAFQSLDILEEYGEPADVGTPLTTIGIIYMREENYDQSEKFLLRALETHKLEEDSTRSASILNNLGLIHFKQKDFNKAIGYFHRTLRMDSISGNRAGMSSTYSNLAISFKNLERYDEAMKYNLLSLQMDRELSSPRGVAASLNNIGGLLLKLKRPEEAIDTFLVGLGIATSIDDKVIMRDFTANLTDAYSEVGNYQEALTYQKQFQALSDSVFNLRSRSKIAELQAQYEMKSTLELMNAEIERRKQLNTFIIIISAVLLGFILFAYNRYRVKQRLRRRMEGLEYERKLLWLQMNPHFIFNALASIGSFINLKDRNRANQYLSKFSNLIRKNLETGRDGRITIHDEIENLKNYLDLEQIRRSEPFTYNIELNDQLSGNEEIVPMLIQPFAENAVLHGVDELGENGEIEIRFFAENDKLICEIEDNGKGMDSLNQNKRNGHKSLSSSIVGEYFENRNLYSSKRKRRGISFRPANEGTKQPGTIVRVELLNI